MMVRVMVGHILKCIRKGHLQEITVLLIFGRKHQNTRRNILSVSLGEIIPSLVPMITVLLEHISAGCKNQRSMEYSYKDLVQTSKTEDQICGNLKIEYLRML